MIIKTVIPKCVSECLTIQCVGCSLRHLKPRNPEKCHRIIKDIEVYYKRFKVCQE